MKHQKASCRGELEHRERVYYDWYRCSKCGTCWTKRKRRPATDKTAAK